MRVWIENPFDNLPHEGFRPQRFWLMAEAFARAGHDVTLWTSDFNHTTKRRRVLRDFSSPVALRLVTAIPYGKNVSLLRMYSHWRYAKAWGRLAEDAARREGKPGLIVISSPPLSTGAVARRLARQYGARLVVDVMDAWPETFERVAPKLALAPLRWMARRNYLGADMITTVADRYLDIVRGYGYQGPVGRFYHGISIARTPAFDAGGRRADGIRLVYIGNLGRTYNLTTVINALAKLPNATLDIAGRGEQEATLAAAGKSLGLGGRVRFHGYLDEEGLARLLSDSDIGIVPMESDSFVGIPYKFADYSRAGVAILSSLGGESAELLERYGAGERYSGGDPADFARAVSRLAENLPAAKTSSRRMAEAEFDAARIYDSYVRACLD